MRSVVSSLFKNKDSVGILIAIGSALIYGLYPAATRGAYAEGANGTFIILFSVFFRALTLILFCGLSGRKMFAARSNVVHGVQNGFFQAASNAGILGAMAFLPGPMVITVLFTYPLWLYLFMLVRRDEKIEVFTMASVLVALVGLVLVINQNAQLDGLSWVGVALAGMASVATATRMYRYGKLMKTIDPAVVGAETFSFVFLFSCLLLFREMPVMPITPMGWVWASLVALSLSIANFGMFYGIALIGAFKFAFFLKLEPIFGAFLSAYLVDEKLSFIQYSGLMMVVGSMFFYQLTEQRRQKKKRNADCPDQ